MAIQNGKKPLSQKAKPTPFNMDDVFGNVLGLDPEIVKEIEAKGLSHRFINAKKLQEMGGYHQFGWTPYKRERGKIGDNQAFVFGSDPEGYIRRGDSILAVRTKELNAKHVAHLKQEAQRSRGLQKAQAQAMREFVSEHGLKDQVHEGYRDEHDEDEEDNE